jgi:hypothetical protein
LVILKILLSLSCPFFISSIDSLNPLIHPSIAYESIYANIFIMMLTLGAYITDSLRLDIASVASLMISAICLFISPLLHMSTT